MLGLIPFHGDLKVLGHDPWSEREALMLDICFVADVAVLPRWMRVSQPLDYVGGVHPRFDRAKAELSSPGPRSQPRSRIRELSKGMVTRNRLAWVIGNQRNSWCWTATLALFTVRKQFSTTY